MSDGKFELWFGDLMPDAQKRLMEFDPTTPMETQTDQKPMVTLRVKSKSSLEELLDEILDDLKETINCDECKKTECEKHPNFGEDVPDIT